MVLLTELYQYEIIETPETPPEELWLRDRTGFIVKVNVTLFYCPDIIKSLTV